MIIESPLTENEVSLLQGYAGITQISVRIWKSLSTVMFTTSIIYLPLLFLSRWLDLFKGSQPYNLALIAGSFAATLYLRREYLQNIFKLPTNDSPYIADIEGGVANVQRLNVKKVLEIEEYEDEGVGFLFELEGGGVLCLISQDYYEYASDFEFEEDEPNTCGDFPQTVIEYRYGPNSGLPLNATGIGDSLRPTFKIPACPKVRKNKKTGEYSYCAPEDGTFYPGNIEDICMKFGYKPIPI
jgi:hypothetical protein